MTEDFELSVTICSWNTREDLAACLDSLWEIRSEARFEVIVVDNNSEDGSPDLVAERFPWVRLERMARNLGFTGGHNHALGLIRAPRVLLLNSDTIVHPGALRVLVDYVDAHPEVGIVGPKLLNPDGTLQYSCRRFPNPTAALFRNTPIGRLFPNNRFTRDYLMTDWGHGETKEVDWVSGAAILASEAVLERVGKLDSEYFMFCEDVDWCFRTWQAGLKVVYVPQSVITHAIGRSTDKAPNRMIGTFHKAMFRFYRKNMARRVIAPLRPIAIGAAGTALFLRASMFVAKNRLDVLRRKVGRK